LSCSRAIATQDGLVEELRHARHGEDLADYAQMTGLLESNPLAQALLLFLTLFVVQLLHLAQRLHCLGHVRLLVSARLGICRARSLRLRRASPTATSGPRAPRARTP
jgi:hypothetical protein